MNKRFLFMLVCTLLVLVNFAVNTLALRITLGLCAVLLVVDIVKQIKELGAAKK